MNKPLFHHSRRTLTSVADWDSATFGSAIEIVQLTPGKFLCQQEVVSFRDILLLRIMSSNGFSARGTGQTSRCVAVLFDQDQAGHFAGAPVKKNELVLLPPFLEFDACVKHGDFGCTVIFVDPAGLSEYYCALTSSALFLDPATLLRFPLQSVVGEGLELWAREILNAASLDAVGLQQPEVLEAMRDEVLTMMVKSLDASISTNLQPEPKLEKSRKLVHRCEDFVLQNPNRHMRLIDLCRETDVSERTLQYAFQEILGLSAMQYLTKIRLHQVQRALTEATPHQTTVSKEACRWGFWHFGEFTKAYRSMFDELPSETLNSER